MKNYRIIDFQLDVKFFTSLLFIISALQLYAGVCNSVGDGDWEDPNTWNCGNEPECGDTIVIEEGHTVVITSQIDLSTCSSETTFFIEGYLGLEDGQKLTLGCTDYFSVSPDGAVHSVGSGGGSSSVIDQCGSTIWQSSDPKLSNYNWSGSLPIELKFFSAQVKRNKIKLKWSTASETNNDYFLIQKSLDGKRFENLDSVKGAGNLSTVSRYRYKDYEPEIGISYYRLKQVDYNGKYSYSNIVSVKYIEKEIKLYPNPGTEGTEMIIESNKLTNFEASLYSINGKEIPVVFYYSKNRIRFKSPQDEGVYRLLLSNNEELKSIKVVIN